MYLVYQTIAVAQAAEESPGTILCFCAGNGNG